MHAIGYKKEEETGFHSSALRDESEYDAAMFEYFKAKRDQPAARGVVGDHAASDARACFSSFVSWVRRLLGLT